MKRLSIHKCEETTNENEVVVFDEQGTHPYKWVLATDYNLQLKVNYCPFCGEKLTKCE